MVTEIFEATPFVVVGAASAAAALTDHRNLKISNWLTVPLLIAGIAFHPAAGSGLFFSVSGAIVGFAALILLYAAGGMGAGDVKLMAGIGAWIGPVMTIRVLLITGIALGITSVVLHVRRSLKNRAKPCCDIPVTVEDLARRPDRRQHLIPFACMLLIGLSGTLIQSTLTVH